MSAFGKRGGMSGGGRPSFGVAKPMKGGPGKAQALPEQPQGGDQFPPLEDLNQSDDPSSENGGSAPLGAMDKLTARQNASGEAGSSKSEGFEASVHRIKEQVL